MGGGAPAGQDPGGLQFCGNRENGDTTVHLANHGKAGGFRLFQKSLQSLKDSQSPFKYLPNDAPLQPAVRLRQAVTQIYGLGFKNPEPFQILNG